MCNRFPLLCTWNHNSIVNRPNSNKNWKKKIHLTYCIHSINWIKQLEEKNKLSTPQTYPKCSISHMNQEQVKPLKPQTNKQPEKELTPIMQLCKKKKKKFTEQSKWMFNQRPELHFVLNLIIFKPRLWITLLLVFPLKQ